MTFTELLECMRSRGISSLADIARELDVSPQSVSNWKARDQVPYKYVIYIQNKYNMDKDMAYSDAADMHDKFESITVDNNKDHLSNIKHNSQYSSQFPFEEDTISLMDILLVLARHIKLIIIMPSIFCTLMIIHVFFIAQPTYVSTATFMSSGSGGKESQMKSLASQLGISVSNSETAQWPYTDVIKSRTLARNMLNRKFDTEKFGSQKTLLQILTYGDKIPTVGLDTLIQGGINAVQGMIKISTSGSMYELEISAFEPQLAADVANGVMDELDRHQREYNARKTTETRKFIEERLVETKTELETAEETLKEFRERNRSILESPQLQLEQGRLTRDVSVFTGVYTTLKQQLETAKIDEVKESDYIVILDEPVIPLYPDKPRKKLMVVLAGILGIGLGVILAFIKEYIMNSNEQAKIKMGKVKSLFVENISDSLPKFFKKNKNS